MPSLKPRASRAFIARSASICLILLLSQFFLFGSTSRATAQSYGESGLQFFPQTGHNVIGLFYEDYLTTGGLNSNGLPITEQFKDSTGMTVQVFERAVFELHQPLESDGQAQPQPYVAHKLLGDMLTAKRRFNKPDPASVPAARHFFEQTGYTLNNGFALYWEEHGGLAEFGYPISQEFEEVNPDDGKTYTVQYFERNRFELHLDLLGTPYGIQLGLLGRQYFNDNHLDPALLTPVKPLALGPQQSLRVPSLMYHHIRELGYDQNLNNYSVTPEAFVAQIDWLQANGYHTVTVAQIADYLKYGIALPDKPVNLRFDDGWQNQLVAARELKKRGMTATFFVITDGRSYPSMTIQDWKQLDADGFEVASHTRNHPFLTRNGYDYDWAQIKGSKDDLERILGHRVRSFAYPFGDHNPAVDNIVAQAGYDVAVTINWSVLWRSSNMFTEPTISVSDIRTLNGFIGRLNTQW